MNLTPRPLPRGPHDLTRDQVEQSQRERLLIAMIDAVAEKGYARTSVADVVSRSGVSRATFYALFEDKAECFRAAYELAARQVAAVLAMGIQERFAGGPGKGKGTSPFQKLEWVLGSYLDILASQPAYAKALLVEVYAAGPQAVRQRQESLEAFVDIAVAVLHEHVGIFGHGPDQRTAVKVLLHGVSSMVTTAIGAGEGEHLADLKEPLGKVLAALLKA